jgi:predicted metalloprotease with PDZ domain
MSPYRYDKENYFDTGYVAEGFTTYYGDLFLVRGGVFGVDWYIGELTRLLKRHFENHGRHNASLVDSSLDLWVDGYRNEAPHRKVSIYVKGALIALMLDLTIRKSTGNQKSLDDLMLSLWKQFGPGTGGYCNEDIQAVAEEISGVELSSFFEQFIYGTAPLENVLEDLMSWVGLKVQLIHPEDQLMGYLGLKTQLSTKGYKVTSTLPDSLGESYFTSDDEIINVNGKPAQPPFNSLMVGKNSFNIIRLGKSRQIEVVLVSKAYYSSPTVSIDASASTLAHESRARWLKSGTGD